MMFIVFGNGEGICISDAYLRLRYPPRPHFGEFAGFGVDFGLIFCLVGLSNRASGPAGGAAWRDWLAGALPPIRLNAITSSATR